jgi:hypothetical protein
MSALGPIAAETVKPDGAVCPLLIRLPRHFCSGVNDVSQNRKWPALFDHLIGAGQQRLRHRNPHRLSDLEVDH